MPTDMKALWADIAKEYGEPRAYSCLTKARLHGSMLIPKTWWAHEHLNLPGARTIIRQHGLTLVKPQPVHGQPFHSAAPRVEESQSYPAPAKREAIKAELREFKLKSLALQKKTTFPGSVWRELAAREEAKLAAEKAEPPQQQRRDFVKPTAPSTTTFPGEAWRELADKTMPEPKGVSDVTPEMRKSLAEHAERDARLRPKREEL